MTVIEDDRLYFLFRRGQHEHIKALCEEGEVYLNPINFFRQCDGNEDRTDRDDGIYYRKFIGEAKITLCEIDKNLDEDGVAMNSFNVVFNTDSKDKGNIFCLTGISSEHLSGKRDDIVFDTRSFGESTILIHNPRVFIERLSTSLEENGFSHVEYGMVTYYNHEYTGAVGFFKKHENFKHQSEYRIFVANPKDEPIKIRIGPLHDIATLNTGVMRLTYTDGKVQHIRL